jgi:hypothetical protein
MNNSKIEDITDKIVNSTGRDNDDRTASGRRLHFLFERLFALRQMLLCMGDRQDSLAHLGSDRLTPYT